MSVHIFDTQLITNLAAGRIVGIIYLPWAILTVRRWIKLVPAKAYLLNFLYLAVLGAFFGFIFPWPDETGQRPFTLLAPGKTMIYLFRMLVDLSLCIFIFDEIRKRPGNLLFIGRMLIVGAVLTATFGAVSLMFSGIDPYNLITGLRELDLLSAGRARGLSFEPRGLGMASSYGIVLLLIYPNLRWSTRLLALAICFSGFVAAFSASSLALLMVGLIVVWWYQRSSMRLIMIASFVGVVVLGYSFSQLYPERFNTGISNITLRLDPSQRTARLGGVAPSNSIEEIAYQLDGFDGSAVLFLADNPIYAVIGTGPALIYLPASNYLLPGAYTAAYSATGINSPPTHGLLLELSNGGLLSLVLWLIQVISCFVALNWLSSRTRHDSSNYDSHPIWWFGKAFFVLGTAFYIVQVSQTSPMWSLVLAVGWSAAYAVRQYKRVFSLTGLYASPVSTPREALINIVN